LIQGGVEETSSDAIGKYRLRGLVPGKRYRIDVKGDGVERCSPSTHSVVMGERDVFDVEFVVFRSQHGLDVSGSIDVPGPWVNSFDVELLGGDVVLRKTEVSPQLHYFEFTSLPAGEFLVRVIANVAGAQGRVAELPVDTRKGDQQVNVAFPDSIESVIDHSGLAPFFTLIIGFLLMFAALNHEAIMLKVKKLRRSTPVASSGWASAGSSRASSRRNSRK
jgi:hypothetical protein